MDFMLNAGGTTCNYDTNLYRNVQHKLWATNDLFRRPVSETPADLGPDSCFLRTCRRNACRSEAGHWRAPLPQSLTQTKGSSDITAKWFGNRCKNGKRPLTGRRRWRTGQTVRGNAPRFSRCRGTLLKACRIALSRSWGFSSGAGGWYSAL